MVDLLLETLQKGFGFPEFRPGQREVIEGIMDNRDVLTVMPTGSGKSLTYQLSSLLLDGITLVVSPLIALMKDQVDFALTLKRDWATFLNSSLPPELRVRRLREILNHKYRLVYIAPERLRTQKFMDVLKSLNVSLLVIDEAHCISFWGHDFRPDYLFIREARKRLNNHRILALTATATPHIQKEIVKELEMRNPAEVILGFDRPNLFLEVVNTPNIQEKYQVLYQKVEELKGSGIVYTGTRQEAEEVTQFLTQLGIEATFYHAGLDREERTKRQDMFMRDEIRVMSATCAFGMGIDKSDIRFIIHFRIPANLETYYQEIGRAGRDEKESKVILFFSLDDQALQTRFITTDIPDSSELRSLFYLIRSLQKNEGVVISREILQLKAGLDETKLRVGLSLLERAGMVKRLLDTQQRMTIQITDSRREEWNKLEEIIQTLKQRKFKSLEGMLDYGRAFTCRRHIILHHFGDIDAPLKCERCDNCQREEVLVVKKDVEIETLKKILEVIKSHELGVEKAAQILSGSKSKSLRFINLEREKHYGIFKDYTQKFLSKKIRYLLEKGYIHKTIAEYPVLYLSEKGKNLLKGELTDLMKQEVALFNEGFRGAEIPSQDLFATLREWRLRMAKTKEIPAYRILHNQTLRDIACRMPSTLEELEEVRGMGERKVAEYGNAILGVLLSRKELSDTIITDFLKGMHPSPLSGSFDLGFALDFNSRFLKGEWQRTEMGQLVHQLKYEFQYSKKDAIIERVKSFLKSHPDFKNVYYIIPVPATIKDRPYNPVFEIAKGLATTTGIALGDGVVKKIKKTQPMKDMTNIVQKQRNIEGAFRVVSPEMIRNKNLLIVDDLYDSGSTINELTKTLRRVEPTKILFLALTKTIHRDDR